MSEKKTRPHEGSGFSKIGRLSFGTAAGVRPERGAFPDVSGTARPGARVDDGRAGDDARPAVVRGGTSPAREMAEDVVRSVPVPVLGIVVKGREATGDRLGLAVLRVASEGPHGFPSAAAGLEAGLLDDFRSERKDSQVPAVS